MSLFDLVINIIESSIMCYFIYKYFDFKNIENTEFAAELSTRHTATKAKVSLCWPNTYLKRRDSVPFAFFTLRVLFCSCFVLGIILLLLSSERCIPLCKCRLFPEAPHEFRRRQSRRCP